MNDHRRPLCPDEVPDCDFQRMLRKFSDSEMIERIVSTYMHRTPYDDCMVHNCMMLHMDRLNCLETLRTYPPGGILTRSPNCDYTFNGTKVTIPKSTPTWIPVYALHYDHDIYPKPEMFDPERFSEDAAAARHPMYYLPFGDGPRNCIGERLAFLQTKIGLITLLRNHKVDVCEKTKTPYEFDPAAFITGPKGEVYLSKESGVVATSCSVANRRRFASDGTFLFSTERHLYTISSICVGLSV